jgi:hypothetical protein
MLSWCGEEGEDRHFLLYTEARWLSLGKAVVRFLNLLEEIEVLTAFRTWILHRTG